MSPLRKLTGRWVVEGAYEASGSLAGEPVGGDDVRDLAVRHLDGSTGATLERLAEFRNLERLTLENVSAVDLRPLAGIGVGSLTMLRTDAIDVSALSDLPALRLLGVRDARDWGIPKPLRLPRSLRGLACGNDGADQTGDEIKALIEAIDWRSVPKLQSLSLRVGGSHALPPIRVDLDFLRCLPALRSLEVPQGVWHAGEKPSPLEPPFDGLSTQLGRIEIDADDATTVREALVNRARGEVSVHQREPLVAEPEWFIYGPSDRSKSWTTYGCLRDLFGGEGDEYEAAEEAERRVLAADPTLASRLDLEPESAGTGITAPSRQDLEQAMRLFGIPMPKP